MIDNMYIELMMYLRGKYKIQRVYLYNTMNFKNVSKQSILEIYFIVISNQ